MDYAFRIDRRRAARPALGLALLVTACHVGHTAAPDAPSAAPPPGRPARVETEPALGPVASAETQAPTEQPGPAASATESDVPAESEKLPLTPEAQALALQCATGDASGCDELGYVLRKLGRYADIQRAFAAACAAKLPAGCGHEAWAIEEGVGSAADAERGQALHERACQMGHAPSCARLGQLHDRSTATGHATKALRYWSRACDLAGDRACRQVGEHYRDGVGAPVDLAAARRAFTRGCDTHDSQSCLLLCTVGSTIPFCTGGGVKQRP